MCYKFHGFLSKEWKEFRGFCFSAFRILRRHANVVLNLFSLMLDSGIPDIAVEKEKAVQKVEQRYAFLCFSWFVFKNIS